MSKSASRRAHSAGAFFAPRSICSLYAHSVTLVVRYRRLRLAPQVNHVGHFQLTLALLPLLKASAPARIVHVSSAAHRYAPLHQRWLSLDFLNDGGAHSMVERYGMAKLAQLAFSNELHRRLQASGDTQVCAAEATFRKLCTVALGRSRAIEAAYRGRTKYKAEAVANPWFSGWLPTIGNARETVCEAVHRRLRHYHRLRRRRNRILLPPGRRFSRTPSTRASLQRSS